MKKCKDCECLFNSHENCPSCGSENIVNYNPADERQREAKEDLGVMVEFSSLDDYKVEAVDE